MTPVTENLPAPDAASHDAVQTAGTLAPTSLAEVIEHVMRLTNDELLLIPFLYTTPGTRGYFTAVGRLLTMQPGPIPAGSPLHRYGSPTPTAPAVDWRTHVDDAPMSLWGELTLLRQLHGSVPAPDPYAELMLLRDKH